MQFSSIAQQSLKPVFTKNLLWSDTPFQSPHVSIITDSFYLKNMISDVWSENEIPKPLITTPNASYKMGVVSQCIQASEAAALGHLWVLRDWKQKYAERYWGTASILQRYFNTRQAKWSGHMMPALSGKWEGSLVPKEVHMGFSSNQISFSMHTSAIPAPILL